MNQLDLTALPTPGPLLRGALAGTLLFVLACEGPAPTAITEAGETDASFQLNKAPPAAPLVSATGMIVVEVEGDVGNGSEARPLIFMDGVKVSAPELRRFLESADLASVTVIRGAEALERYGERARGGVVRITTKGG